MVKWFETWTFRFPNRNTFDCCSKEFIKEHKIITRISIKRTMKMCVCFFYSNCIPCRPFEYIESEGQKALVKSNRRIEGQLWIKLYLKVGRFFLAFIIEPIEWKCRATVKKKTQFIDLIDWFSNLNRNVWAFQYVKTVNGENRFGNVNEVEWWESWKPPIK